MTQQISLWEPAKVLPKLEFVNRSSVVADVAAVFEKNFKLAKSIEKLNYINADSYIRELHFVCGNDTYGAGKTRFGEEFLIQLSKKQPKTEIENAIASAIRVPVMYRTMIITSKTLEDALIDGILIKLPVKGAKDFFETWYARNASIIKEKYEKESKLFCLGYFLSHILSIDQSKFQHVYIFFDEIDVLLSQDFPELEGKSVFQSAYCIWNAILELMIVPGIHVYSTSRAPVFQFLGQHLATDCKSPCGFYPVYFNTFKRVHLDEIVDKTSGLEQLRLIKRTNKDLYDYFLDLLQEKSQGVPIVVSKIFLEFTLKIWYEFTQESILEFFNSHMVNFFVNDASEAAIICPLFQENIKFKSENFKTFYLIMIKLAMYQIPIDISCNLSPDQLPFPEFSSLKRVPLRLCISMCGMYTEYDPVNKKYFAKIPEYTLKILHRYQQELCDSSILPLVLVLNPKDVHHGNILEQMGHNSLVERFKIDYPLPIGEKLSFFAPTSIANNQWSIRKTVLFPKFVSGKKKIDEEKLKKFLEGKLELNNNLQYSYIFYPYFEAMLSDEVLIKFRGESHIGDAVIKWKEARCVFQYKNEINNFTFSKIRNEFDKIAKLQFDDNRKLILVFVVLNVSKEIELNNGVFYKKLTKTDPTIGPYVLRPDMEIVVVSGVALERFIGKTNYELLLLLKEENGPQKVLEQYLGNAIELRKRPNPQLIFPPRKKIKLEKVSQKQEITIPEEIDKLFDEAAKRMRRNKSELLSHACFLVRNYYDSIDALKEMTTDDWKELRTEQHLPLRLCKVLQEIITQKKLENP